jgi:NADH:ubiquinone reductase (H+-translocating)
MGAKRVVVLGGGFAGLWSAVGAARKLDELGLGPEAVEVILVNRDAFHCIRVRNYEADLSSVRVPLDDVLGPIGVRRVQAEVADINLSGRNVTVTNADGAQTLHYDRLVFALGSQLVRPNVAGVAEHAFDVDTFNAAARLDAHLKSLPGRPESPGRMTVVVVGAGLTGVEAAAEMPERLQAVLAQLNRNGPVRVILADHQAEVGSDMGDSARPVIEEALRSLAVEIRTGIEIVAIDAFGVMLRSGEQICADTVVWCAGMRANPLTGRFPVEPDRLGRLPVDEFMRVVGTADVFAAGDVAAAVVDDHHESVMSCQHARPMGRFAGHNVVTDLLGLPLLPLRIEWYVTVLDLGAWGAVYTEGWDRQVVSTGDAAKRTKQTINCQRIYPPLSGIRSEILAAAAPVVQRPPGVRRGDHVHAHNLLDIRAHRSKEDEMPPSDEAFFEDLAVGQTFHSGAITVELEEVRTFAARFDPQPFHLDETAGANSFFGELVASGWHTAALTMRLIVTSDLKISGGSIGMGVDQIRWPRPVRPGDVLRVESEVIEMRPSRSNPERGIVKMRSKTLNQNGETVMEQTANLIVPRKALREAGTSS